MTPQAAIDAMAAPRKSRDPRPVTEQQIHEAVVAHLRLRAYPDVIWFHPANGEERPGRVGAKLQRMGVLPGVPDLCLIDFLREAHFLEIKTAKGKLSLDQQDFKERCCLTDVHFAVAHSVDEALRILEKWRLIPPERA